MGIVVLKTSPKYPSHLAVISVGYGSLGYLGLKFS